ncbi:RPE65-domain-containing protein [Pseudovirgaria hyperparasitica]|uniref:RPE65-domain-containing protein n=1 Tax=Pseudovirgaria hyperparasitica TaxID=470096 RepID=A0A6A6W3T7_9PEZI|nr:RPE65-domain-containing protein [Pseudovirgaria hyperparasitica]KAF2757283.1 RPE65-domain-containing protein [Pseudovirgaria hyperparasitica]
MPLTGQKRKRQHKHPYLSGNFAPIHHTRPLTPCSYSGQIPDDLAGGQYLRNGGNPISNQQLGRDAHWFDGDGMLAGVLFEKSTRDGSIQPSFVNQYILTDVNISASSSPTLRTPILPSITTLVNPASSLVYIILRILRTVFLAILAGLPGSKQAIKRISVANTSILYHDGRALATCESGPPMRVQLPDLDTVGWFNGEFAEGESSQHQSTAEVLGGPGLVGFMKEWTTGHPKVDPVSKEMLLFHCTFIQPYVHYSILPSSHGVSSPVGLSKSVNIPVPGVSGGKMMHDFGASRTHTVILDLPLSLDPFNLMKNRPVVSYDAKKPSRFGVFPRRDPAKVQWFETDACCIFHTANTWDVCGSDGNGDVVELNMLACRLTSATLVFNAGNIAAPPPPGSRHAEDPRRPISFFAAYENEKIYRADEDEDESSPLLHHLTPSTLNWDIEKTARENLPSEQCRLYLYTFSLSSLKSSISRQFALSTLPFEFPTLNNEYSMLKAQYIYGCSTYTSSFGAALGKATKIDVLLKMDVQNLIKTAEQHDISDGGCVDERNIDEILASSNAQDPIKAFRMPPGWFAQEATFVARREGSKWFTGKEDDGYLLFYAFDESQLDDEGNCPDKAVSELWVLDATDMKDIVAKVRLPQRVPYGLHGNWFTEKMITDQRPVESFRKLQAPGFDLSTQQVHFITQQYPLRMHKGGGVSKPRLTCEACTRRKVKCDKKVPCTNCDRSGVTCVPVERQRLPRGRHLNRRSEPSNDADVRDRLARLESLVLQQSNNLAQTKSPSNADEEGEPSSTPESRPGSFTEGHRGFPLNPSATWGDALPHPKTSTSTPSHTIGGSPFTFSDSIPTPQSFLDEVEHAAVPWLHQNLCETFISNVDPVFKVLHRPSVAAHLIKGGLYLNYPPDSPAVEALDYAIYHAAVASLTAEQAMQTFGQAKNVVIKRYRLAVEAALSRADFVVTEDLTVLQAFVLYLVATRSYDRSRRVWTLLSLAVRLAQSLNIHVDNPSVHLMRPYDREMAKRVWWAIGLLDIQAAMERGADPMITNEWLQATALPLNINDVDFSVDSEGPLIESTDYTDMTLSLVGSKAQGVGRILNFPPRLGHSQTVTDWYARHRLVEDFRLDIQNLVQWHKVDKDTEQIRWHIKQMFEGLVASMQLNAVRPLRPQPIEQPPNVKGSHLLRLAVTSLIKDKEVSDDRRNDPWIWFANLWAPWHDLAVALSELSVCEDPQLVKSCWKPINAAFSRLSDKVVDSHSTLWGPMENLMEQAKARYQSVMSNSAMPTSSIAMPMPNAIPSPARSQNSQQPSPQTANINLTHRSPQSSHSDPTFWAGFDGNQYWPSLDSELDLMSATTASDVDTAAWATWDNFLGNIQRGDEFGFSFS